MRRTNLSFAILAAILGLAGSAKSADPPSAPATTASAATKTPPAPGLAEIVLGRQRQESQQQAWQEAHKPTEWQLQNPSGIDNRYPTSREIPGYVAPNSYFGPQFREWNQMSPPVSQSQWPANMTPTTPLLQTNIPVAPLSYWGAGSAQWSNVTVPRPQASPLGGWTIPGGW